MSKKKCKCKEHGHEHDGDGVCDYHMNDYDGETCDCPNPSKKVTFSEAYNKLRREKDEEVWANGKWSITAEKQFMNHIDAFVETLDKFLPEIDEEDL